jgi:hypothetical protein
VTERGEHCRGNHDFSQHMESPSYNLAGDDHRPGDSSLERSANDL